MTKQQLIKSILYFAEFYGNKAGTDIPSVVRMIKNTNIILEYSQTLKQEGSFTFK